MSVSKDHQKMIELIEAARKLGPMTDEQRREQNASFAFGNLALTSDWTNSSETELQALYTLCRNLAGCKL